MRGQLEDPVEAVMIKNKNSLADSFFPIVTQVIMITYMKKQFWED